MPDTRPPVVLSHRKAVASVWLSADVAGRTVGSAGDGPVPEPVDGSAVVASDPERVAPGPTVVHSAGGGAVPGATSHPTARAWSA